MKTIAIVLALIFIGIAIVYFVVPANLLPSFFPGFDPSLARTHMKHGIASAAIGVVLLVVGWMMGRR